MNEEIDDIDFFQQDFTTASAFELFNARLEQIFQHWTLKEEFLKTLKPALKKNELFLNQWETVCESISFADFELVV
jgi:Rab3 GTPase-activating protein catalytic subunit